MYKIHVPVGKGLTIDPDQPGHYVFFCGGTGILPFLDAFAVMLRKGIELTKPDFRVFKDENLSKLHPELYFSILVYFPSKD